MFLLVALVLFYQLILPPVTGLADNWDYIHVLREDHLLPVDANSPDRYISYIVPTFRYDPAMAGAPQVRTSEAWLIRATLLLNYLVSKDGLYDLRWAGLAHSVIFLTGLWLALPLFRRISYRFRIAALALTAIIFWDPLYVTYYNSFYSDASSLSSFFLGAVLLLRLMVREGSTKSNWIGFSLTAAFFFASKAQHLPMLLPTLILLGVWLASRPNVQRPLVIAGVLLMICADLWIYTSVAKLYQSMAFYNTVFTGLLTESENRPEVLRDLGLSEAFATYAGTNSFSEGGPMKDPQFAEMFQHSMSYGKLAKYYFSHPAKTLKMLWFAMKESGYIRQPYLGNFAPGTGHAKSEMSYAFALWSSLKHGAFFEHPAVATAFLFIPFFTMVGLSFGRSWLFRIDQLVAIVMLFSMAFGEFLISGLMDVAETARHLVLYQEITDVLFLLAVVTVFRVVDHNRAASLAAVHME